MAVAAAFTMIVIAPTGAAATVATCPVPPGTTGVTDVGCAGMFELDGNIPHDSLTTPPWDWAKDATGHGGVMNNDGSAVSNGITGAIVNSGVIADYAQPDNSYFQQNKDIENSSAWGCVSQSQPTPKDDLLNAYAVVFEPASGPRAGHRILYVASERQQNNGNAYAGFWLLQNPTSCSPTANGGSFQTSGHSTGDFLLLANYTNGGSVAGLSVLRWDPTAPNNLAGVATSTDCRDVNSTADICGRVNSAPETPPWPNSSGTPASLPEPTGDFLEIGIDMTALGLDHTAGGQTLCSSSFLAESRSSQEATATLKDYASGAFDICRRPTATTSVDGNGTTSVKPGASVFDSATLSGASPTASGTVTYNLYAGSACTGTPVFSSTKTVTNGLVPNSDPWTATVGSYQWQATYSGDLASGGIDQPTSSTCGAEPLTVIAPTVVPTPSPSPVTVVQAATVTPAKTGDWTILMVLGAPLLLIGFLLLVMSRRRREVEA